MVRIDTEPEPPRVVRSKLVGRGDALATLRDVVGRAVDFQAPQLVTIVGNQGTGKTRLINELISELRDQLVDQPGLAGALIADDRHELRRLKIDRAPDHVAQRR